jgi:hypothetical protein
MGVAGQKDLAGSRYFSFSFLSQFAKAFNGVDGGFMRFVLTLFF